MASGDREMLSNFLTQGGASGYIPQSGEIVGILKQMTDEMEKDLADVKSTEADAIANYEALVAAKTKEIEAATKAIEEKLGRVGELGVELASMKNDLEDTMEGLAEDKKFLADLSKNCELKEKEWAEYKKVQAEELVAIADTIKILNDDDALELFKKTLPGSGSLLQVKVSDARVRKLALLAVATAKGD